MDGAILLVDATSPVDEFVEHLYTSIGPGKIPFVVFLNKCDAVGAKPDAAKAHFPGPRYAAVSSQDHKQARTAVENFIGTLRPHVTGSASA